MKSKIISVLIAFFAEANMANAQIFNYTETLDKFDDVISEKSVKTLIRKNDSIFSFEEKGGNPVYYRIIISDIYQPRYVGSKDHPELLVNNTYGYEEELCAVPMDSLAKYYALVEEANSKPDTLIITHNPDGSIGGYNERTTLNMSASFFLMHSIVSITHRVVTTQYTGTFIDEMYWISYQDESRKIYMNKR